MSGLKGLNKRLTDTAEGECYLTTRWAVEWLLERWAPIGNVVCDPCACGFRGWSIGKMVAERYRLPLEASDIDPQDSSVAQADFRFLGLQPASRTIITNPPYDMLSAGEFISWAFRHAEEVVVLTRFGFLCAGQGSRANELYAYIQPAKRLAFELLPDEAMRRLEAKRRGEKVDIHEDPSTLTGYRCSSTGVDHGWAVYRRGHKGPAKLIIEAA